MCLIKHIQIQLYQTHIDFHNEPNDVLNLCTICYQCLHHHKSCPIYHHVIQATIGYKIYHTLKVIVRVAVETESSHIAKVASSSTIPFKLWLNELILCTNVVFYSFWTFCSLLINVIYHWHGMVQKYERKDHKASFQTLKELDMTLELWH